jgi:pyridoxine 4-dehydrogenase
LPSPDAALSSTFKIGGELAVHRLGFGTMRVTGRGIWGEPADRAEVFRTLKRLPALGVNFIDTADSHGPDVSEKLLHEALHPYQGLVVATKGGLTRPGPDRWVPQGRPDYLIAQARKSLDKLGVQQIDLWQLHRIDPRVPRGEQFGPIKTLLDEGVIRHAGLSEVSVEEIIEAASKLISVATVQNRYNLADRSSEDVPEHCERHGLAAAGIIDTMPPGLINGEHRQTRLPVPARVERGRGAWQAYSKANAPVSKRISPWLH